MPDRFYGSSGIPRDPPMMTVAACLSGLAIVPCLCAAAVPNQQIYLKAANRGSLDAFGTAVAVSGETAVVGAPYECSNATGVNANGYNESALDAGAAYVFVRSGGLWVQQAYLKASNAGAHDSFGWSVAISGDTIVVGALLEDGSATGINGDQASDDAVASGAAYVFTRSGGTWTQQAYLKASNSQAADLFGSAVAVSGNTVVVGANREDSNATGVNGNGASNSADRSGAAYVFSRTGSTWTQQAYLKASDTAIAAEFGGSVGISGTSIVVGAPLANGDSGAIYLFNRSGSTWSQAARLTASNAAPAARFGYSVAISGDTVAAGASGEASAATGVNGNQGDSSAPGAGAAYVFQRAGASWLQQAYLKPSNTGAADCFGETLCLDGDKLVVGAFGEDSPASGVDGNGSGNTAESSGAAYYFSRTAGAWMQEGYLKASNTETGDWFGAAVAVSGDTILIGSERECGSGVGVNGVQNGNGATGSGAVYGFVIPPPPVPDIAVEASGGLELTDGGGGVALAASGAGKVTSRNFIVTNAGTGVLSINGSSLGGADAARFSIDASGVPASLAAGASGILTVQFNGPTVRSYAATLQILSNAAGESPFDIALSASVQTTADLYNAWTAASGLAAQSAEPGAIPFHDGVENLLKYAFHMNGSGTDTRSLDAGGGLAGLPVFRAVTVANQPVFRAEYLRRKGSGLTYLAKVSPSLLSASFVPMTGSVNVTDLDALWERVRIDQPRVAGKAFGIVEVTPP